MKEHLRCAPVLVHPDYARLFLLYTDASDTGLAGVLLQEQDDGSHRVVRYLSRSLSRAEKNYPASQKEALALVWSVRTLRAYLIGTTFTILTDCSALRTMRTLADSNSRIMRWHLFLQPFTFGIKYVKGSENISDIFSRMDLTDLDEAALDFQLKDLYEAFWENNY